MATRKTSARSSKLRKSVGRPYLPETLALAASLPPDEADEFMAAFEEGRARDAAIDEQLLPVILERALKFDLGIDEDDA